MCGTVAPEKRCARGWMRWPPVAGPPGWDGIMGREWPGRSCSASPPCACAIPAGAGPPPTPPTPRAHLGHVDNPQRVLDIHHHLYMCARVRMHGVCVYVCVCVCVCVCLKHVCMCVNTVWSCLLTPCERVYWTTTYTRTWGSSTVGVAKIW